MDVEPRGHWLGGEECLGRAEWETPCGEELHTWTRARAADLHTALGLAAGEGAQAWRQTAPAERSEVLAAAVEELAGGRVWRSRAAACLGVSAEELAPQVAGLAHWRPRTAATSAESGPAIHLGHWSEGLGVAAGRCLARLAAGQSTLYLGDLEQPWTGHALGAALSAAGLPAGAFAALHGATPELASAWESHAPARFQGRIDGSAAGWAKRLPAEHCVERWERSWAFVGDRADALRSAEVAVRVAFGRAEALGGQAHGRIGVALVAERNFSAFSDALLAALEASGGERRSVPPVNRALERAHQDVVRRALQAGECLIAGGDRGTDGRLAWGPAVFTNGEPGQDAVRDPRPLPLFHLLRLPRGGSPELLGAALGCRWGGSLG